jgi:hypothetical protein
MQAIDAPRRGDRTLSDIVEFEAAVIIVFDVPPDGDADFTAAWQRTRGRLPTTGTTLHRALREDVDFRFVAVAYVDDPRAWEQATTEPMPWIGAATPSPPPSCDSTRSSLCRAGAPALPALALVATVSQLERQTTETDRRSIIGPK